MNKFLAATIANFNSVLAEFIDDFVALSRNRRDGDSIDRINHQYSPALFVLLTIVISVKQYVGAPIDCWCPAQFTDSHVAYTNAICWVNRFVVLHVWLSCANNNQNPKIGVYTGNVFKQLTLEIRVIVESLEIKGRALLF
jgi:hypothetical protein